MLQAADLPSDLTSIWIGPESRNDCGTFLCQQCRSFPDRGPEIDACLQPYIPHGLLTHAAQLSGDLACIWVAPECRDDLRPPLWRKPAPSPGRAAGGELDTLGFGDPPHACVGDARDALGN